MEDVPNVVVIDANVLVCICEQGGDRKEKLEHLFAKIDKAKGRVVIPTPAVAEFLVNADQAGLAILESLQRRASIYIAAFDLAAAFEASQIDAAAIGRNDKRDGSSAAWQKIKIDRQIVAIGKTHGAKLIISDDAGVQATAARLGIRGISIGDIPLPDHARQGKLPIEAPERHE